MGCETSFRSLKTLSWNSINWSSVRDCIFGINDLKNPILGHSRATDFSSNLLFIDWNKAASDSSARRLEQLLFDDAFI